MDGQSSRICAGPGPGPGPGPGQGLALTVVLLVAALLRLWDLSAWPYSWDETLTVATSMEATPTLAVQRVMGWENTPPQYYLIMWGWTRLVGRSEVAVRSLSALAGVGAVWAMYALGRRLGGVRAGMMAAALLALNPMHVHHSREARTYALYMLLMASSYLLQLRMMERFTIGRWMALVIVGGAMQWAHTFAVLVLAAQAIGFAWIKWQRRTAAPWWAGLGAPVASFALFVPYLPVVAGWTRQSSEPLRLTGNTLSQFGEALRTMAGSWTAAGLLGALSGVGVWAAWRGSRAASTASPRPPDSQSGTVALAVTLPWLVLPLGVMTLVTAVRQPLLVPRYSIATMLAWLVLAAMGLAAIPGRWIRMAVVAGTLACVAWSTELADANNDDWRSVARLLEARAVSGDAVLVYRPESTVPMKVYFRRTDVPVGFIERPMSDVPIAPKYTRIWLALSDGASPPVGDLVGSPWKVMGITAFPGMHVYEVNRSGN